jgi:hypothetical protein
MRTWIAKDSARLILAAGEVLFVATGHGVDADVYDHARPADAAAEDREPFGVKWPDGQETVIHNADVLERLVGSTIVRLSLSDGIGFVDSVRDGKAQEVMINVVLSAADRRPILICSEL